MDKIKQLVTGILDITKDKPVYNPNVKTVISSSPIPDVRTTQNFRVVWLDSHIDEINNIDCKSTLTKLRETVNDVHTFTDVDVCFDFITDIEDEKIFMIISGTLGQITMTIMHEFTQINSIYIFCVHKEQHEQWAKQFPKVKGVFTSVIPLCEALKQAAQDCDQNSISISFVKMTDEVSKTDLNQLDQSFMYTQILKEILFTIDFNQEYFNDFIMFCRDYFINNRIELKNTDKIEREYRHHEPIWWYSYHCFLYSMLNKALRTMEVDIIIKFGFFARDLHQHIERLHSKQYEGRRRSKTFTVYRGQGLSHPDFNELMKTQGGLLSFNCFLSTSKKRNVALTFVQRTVETSSLMGILFIINIQSCIRSTPFANITNISEFKKEEEILFSMHSIFRIGQIEQIDKANVRLWQVKLTLTNDNDPQLQRLTEHIRKETFCGHEGWYRLGMLLKKLGEYDKAEQVYNVLLEKSTSKSEKGHLYHMLGMIALDQGKYQDTVDFCEQSLKINQEILPRTHSDLATSYMNIGSAYGNMKEYRKALEYHTAACKIYDQNPPQDQTTLATAFNNIGFVYEGMEKYLLALSYYKKAFVIYQKFLPLNHPNLADSYSNIGSVYESMGQYSKALSSHKKAHEIYQHTYLPNHPELARSYGNMGMVFSQIGDQSKAIACCERALKILEQSLPPNHPKVKLYKANLESVKGN